jgi:hypothetical protein
MDSKIVHTTRMDSNFSNILFSTFVLETVRKDWVDFNTIWKEFSKFHTDVLEDDMEKIFHYIDKKIDESDNDSDFQYLNANISFLKFKSDERFKMISDNDILNENKINGEGHKNQPLKMEYLNGSKILDHNKTEFEKYSKKIKINFCGPPVRSPAISPINSNKNLIELFDYTNKAKKNNLETRSDYKKFKKQIKYNLKIQTVTNFSLNSQRNNKIIYNKIPIDKELKLINYELTSINENDFQIDNTKFCCYCKENIIKD